MWVETWLEKKTQDDIELTEAEKEILQEIIMTYKSVKMMSRLIKWMAFIPLYGYPLFCSSYGCNRQCLCTF